MQVSRTPVPLLSTTVTILALLLVARCGLFATFDHAQGSTGLVLRSAAYASFPIQRHQPVLALTFDDGPQPYYTAQVLQLLHRFRIHATFFVVGRQAAAFPDLVRAEAAASDEVENHTWSHSNLTLLSVVDATAQIGGTADVVQWLTGRAPQLLRPPYGHFNAIVLHEASMMDERVVLWNVDPRDWARPGVRAIANGILKHARDGAIVLLHDGGGRREQTLAALHLAIPVLEARGYQFVTMAELLAPPRHRPGLA